MEVVNIKFNNDTCDVVVGLFQDYLWLPLFYHNNI